MNVRVGSRAGEPPFDWEDPSTWAGAVAGVQSAYLMYYPEIEWPGAGDAIAAVARLAVDAGVERLVLLSARNQDEAVRCEDAVTSLPVEWTIVAPASFNQNFDEGVFLEPLRNGVLALPAGDNADPFIDADDIADVAVAALTEDGHVGERYELTGPRLWTFAEGVGEIARATGRELRYVPITRDQFADAVVDDGAPARVRRAAGHAHLRVLRRPEQLAGRRRRACPEPQAPRLRGLGGRDRPHRRMGRRLDETALRALVLQSLGLKA
ncbi:NmrA family transcriptional regulator [Nonomuraea dietziae]|uniref:NmrA family transcriptional regulator n=1 Tax=Nonomuraea dietziae TaxID=65515 RepID=UPI0033C87C4F